MSDTRFCKDCRFYGPESRCQHSKAHRVDPVTGEPSQLPCSIMRGPFCGCDEGKLFEPKIAEAAE